MSQHHLSSPTPSSFPLESKGNEEQEQVIIARVLASLQPSVSKNLSESDPHNRWQNYATTSLDSTLQMPGMYPVQFQSCGLSGFSPGVAMYQIWQQQQIIQQQNHLLALAIAPPIPSTPHIYPLMQSVLQSDYCLYLPAKGLVSVPVRPRLSVATSSPSFCLSNPTDPDLNRSTVVIREIHEEKAENSFESSQSAVPDFPVCNISEETRALRPTQEDERQKQGGSESRSTNVELHNPPGIDTYRPILRAHPKVNANRSFRPPSSASSMIRTMGFASSGGSRPQQREFFRAVSSRARTGSPRSPAMATSARFDMVGAPPPPLSMAPPVRIRSVVPVCSAPPRRAIEEMSENKEKKKELKHEDEDVSRTSSKLGNLRI